MSELNERRAYGSVQEELVYAALSRAAATLAVRVERSEIDLDAILAEDPEEDLVSCFEVAGEQLGLAVKEAEFSDVRDIYELVSEGYPIVVVRSDTECRLLLRCLGKRLEVVRVKPRDVSSVSMSRREVQRLISEDQAVRVLVIKTELECDTISSSPVHELTRGQEKQLTPFMRFVGLLRMDLRDISLVVLFAMVAGILSLATPLAVESLVNVVSWGVYIQPLIILAIILLTCLGISAALSVLQTIVVEIIQRRQLVRIASDLAHRFPRANQAYLNSTYPRELANRVFDIMTIQKATAILLLDGVSIVLTTLLGLLLLAFYHPFLLGFDIVLVLSMTLITWALGRDGVRTAIKESKTKYAIAHWLQDVLDSPTAFRVNGGEMLAIDRASRLATEYVAARKNQFRVVLRQIVFAISLQVVASTVLLGLGGWLVIQRQLTLGQLVASELVVTVVVGAFSKAGKALEKYYDLMAGIDKVGQLLDIPVDIDEEVVLEHGATAQLKWDELVLRSGLNEARVPANTISAGNFACIVSPHSATLVMDAFAGLCDPESGVIDYGGYDVNRLSAGCHQGQVIAYASKPEIFHGSLADNIELGRSCVGRGRVRELLQSLDLWDDVVRLEGGLETQLTSDGFPLTESQRLRLVLARAVAARPRVLLIDGLLDQFPPAERDDLIQFLKAEDEQRITIVSTRLESVAEVCNQRIELGN